MNIEQELYSKMTKMKAIYASETKLTIIRSDSLIILPKINFGSFKTLLLFSEQW